MSIIPYTTAQELKTLKKECEDLRKQLSKLLDEKLELTVENKVLQLLLKEAKKKNKKGK